MEVRSQLHAPAALPPEKNPVYTLYRRLGSWSPEPVSRRGGKEEKTQLLTGIESHSSSL
jgi:hypothetical protein